MGVSGTYNVTTTGYPAPTVTESGALPSGLTFTEAGNGTATIAGTPAAGTTGSYPVSLSAANASGSTATLALTLTVGSATAAPAITSAASTTFTARPAGVLHGDDHRRPGPRPERDRALPSGVTFTDNGNGTATAHRQPDLGQCGVLPVDDHRIQ